MRIDYIVATHTPPDAGDTHPSIVTPALWRLIRFHPSSLSIPIITILRHIFEAGKKEGEEGDEEGGGGGVVGVGADVEGDVSTFLLVNIAIGERRRYLLQEYGLESSALQETSAVNTLEQPRADAEEGRQRERG